MEIYFRLNGGLGNQLSQYSAAKYFENKYKVLVKFDDFYIKKSKKTHEQIHLFNIFENLVTINNICSKISRIINRSLDKLGYKTIEILGYKFYFDKINDPIKDVSANTIIIYEGFWQNNYIYNYDIVEKIFDSVVKNLEYKKSKIFDFEKSIKRDSINIALHIRRGDYLTNREYLRKQQFVMPASYYSNAINELKKIYINKNLLFYIFSDDPFNLKEFENYNINTYFVNEFSDLESFYLFSKFKISIIANSTYSMWAALISTYLFNGIAYAPSLWHKNKIDIEIIPKNFNIINII